MRDEEKLPTSARQLLDEDLELRSPRYARRLQDIRNAALERASAGSRVQWHPGWWISGAAAAVLLVLIVPATRQLNSTDAVQFAGQAAAVQAQSDLEIAEVLDNLDMLLFIEEEGIDASDDAQLLDDEFGSFGVAAEQEGYS